MPFLTENQEPETAGRKAKCFHEHQKVRRTNPRLYYSTAYQSKVLSHIEALGSETFFAAAKEDE